MSRNGWILAALLTALALATIWNAESGGQKRWHHYGITGNTDLHRRLHTGSAAKRKRLNRTGQARKAVSSSTERSRGSAVIQIRLSFAGAADAGTAVASDPFGCLGDMLTFKGARPEDRDVGD